MTPIELFVVLVGLAFIGSVRAARGSSDGMGLTSGVEYVVLGFVMGPRLLGLVTQGAVQEFEALLLMALGWLVAVRGANFVQDWTQRSSVGHLLLSTLLAALCAACIYAACFAVSSFFVLPDARLLSLGVTAVSVESTRPRQSSETTGQAGQAPSGRYTGGTELVPILVLGTMSLGGPLHLLPIPTVYLPLLTALLSVLLGALLGGVVTALVDLHFEHAELWPLLVGAVLLVVGTALRLDLPAATPTFVLGLVISIFSRHRRDVRRLMNGTERQLLLPCLLLAGAVLHWPSEAGQWLVVAAALGVRWFFKGILGLLAARRAVPSGDAWASPWRTLQRASGFTLIIGLMVFLRQSDELGRIVLTVSVLSVASGELFCLRWRRGGLVPLADETSVQLTAKEEPS